ncbi:elongation factor Tu, partial [Haemophilus influenzae R3021]
MFPQLLDECPPGEYNCDLIPRTYIATNSHGHSSSKPGSFAPHTDYGCYTYVLNQRRGGPSMQFLKGYLPPSFFSS